MAGFRQQLRKSEWIAAALSRPFFQSMRNVLTGLMERHRFHLIRDRSSEPSRGSNTSLVQGCSDQR